MPPKSLLSILIGKFVIFVSKLFNIGSGGTWPGEIALRLSPGFLSDFSKYLANGVILVAGTNGKTTASLMIKSILEANGGMVIHNSSGANLLNGLASSFISSYNLLGNSKNMILQFLR